MRRLFHAAYLGLRHPRVVRTLAGLERSQWLPAPALREMQEERLGELLAHAGSRVPFYREAFARAGIDPRRPGGRQALEALPILTREIIRARASDLVSEDSDRRGSFKNATGGSTGTPLSFLQDRTYEVHRRAAMYRGFRWCGWPLGGKLAVLWGVDPDSGSRSWRGRLLEGLFGNRRIDAFALEEAGIDAILDGLAAQQPDLVVGYASSLRLLARRALERGGGPALRAVESSAEMLDPAVRGEIERAFGCRVYDRYGCREAGVVAHECGSGLGWHVNTESVLVETDPEGNLLVTTLMNYSMPLIRYRNEDVVEMGSARCACGRGLPLLSRIHGRRSDIIRSPSGRAIHGEFFTHLFYDLPSVIAFQVVQTDRESLLIRTVSREGPGEEERERVSRAILERGDAAFRITWERVDRIPAGPSGKHRFTIGLAGGGDREGRP